MHATRLDDSTNAFDLWGARYELTEAELDGLRRRVARLERDLADHRVVRGGRDGNRTGERRRARHRRPSAPASPRSH